MNQTENQECGGSFFSPANPLWILIGIALCILACGLGGYLNRLGQ